MKQIKIYRYEREDGGISVSPQKPDREYKEMIRLVADKDKVLTNDGGKTLYSCIDVISSEKFEEIDKPKNENKTN